MKSAFLFFIIWAFILPGGCQGKDQHLTGTDFIQNSVDSIYKKEKLPGIIVAVEKDGKRSYYSAGFADPVTKKPFDSLTVFEIGSITKTFTAFVLSSVLADHSIDVRSSILKYLPDSVAENKSLSQITFLHLMNHTSGLPRLPSNMNLESAAPYDNYTEEKLFSYLRTCEPGLSGKYDYSNLAAGLGGVLAERISGKKYTDLLDHYIFFPFKMGTCIKNGDSVMNKSQGYFDNDTPVSFWNMAALAPAGNIKCSASGLMKYIYRISHPVSEGEMKLSDSLLAATVQISPVLAAGRGWHILSVKDKSPVYWHNGGTYGFSTFAAFTKEPGISVVVVTNRFNSNSATDAFGFRIISRLRH
jgi:CubicO group peptidase (beta-lactamase class C family)